MKPTRSLLLPIAILVAAFWAGACATHAPSHSERLALPAPFATIVQGHVRRVPPAPLVPPTATPTSSATETIATEDLIKLSSEEQIEVEIAPDRDLTDLAMRLVPDVGQIPRVVNKTTPEYEIGDQIEFWAHDMDSGTDFTITAELIHKTDVAYAWVEVGQDFNRDKLIEIVDRFSEQSYPTEVAYFGSEWNPGVDNDPRLHILHATGLGSYIAGYYSSSDEYSRIAQGSSNEKEMFYVNLDWLNTLSGDDYLEYDTVLAHEFQHMLHWYQDMNEETWIGEGLSEFAQDVAGFGPTNDFSDDFLRLPDTQLDSWGDDSEGNNNHYGAAYLFFVYFAQRFGPDIIGDIVAYPANGVAGINDVLAQSSDELIGDLTFDNIFANWVVANYVDDPDALGLDGIYGYRDFDQRTPAVEKSYDEYPVNQVTSNVYNYGTDYIRLNGEGDVVFNFEGATTTQLAALPVASEAYSSWWSNRGDTSDMKLTRHFDLGDVAPGTDVTMSATMWWDIEEGYDYLYVVASRDGKNWTILDGTSATPSDGISSFGPGYTGASDGFQVEQFDLSDFAGDEIDVRFEYVTDDAINGRGLFLNDVTIPAIDYTSDFDEGDGWESEGWIYTDNRLQQNWILQVMRFDGNTLVGVEPVALNEEGHASVAIDGLGDGQTAVIAISGAAPVILEKATYQYSIDLP